MEIFFVEDNSEQKPSQDDIAEITTEIDTVFADVQRDCLQVANPILDIDEASARVVDQAGEKSLRNSIIAWLARLFSSLNIVTKSSVERQDLQDPKVREEGTSQICSGGTGQAAASIHDNIITIKAGGTWGCAWLTNQFVGSLPWKANSEHSDVNENGRVELTRNTEIQDQSPLLRLPYEIGS
ncbi:hypothetical protein MMC32_006560 [Xylographa parallela]|nr:hypothetical protein [Xylographa parallela]